MAVDERERAAQLAREIGCDERETVAAWESYLFRCSLRMGFLITEPQRDLLWSPFAAGFRICVQNGYEPLAAMDTFEDFQVQMERQRNE